MEQAVEAVRNGQIGLKRAAQQFEVPRATLQRRVQGKVPVAVGTLDRFRVSY